MKIAYLANIRLPTEKAHGLQIAQMCEAFATQPKVTLCLYAARRHNTSEMNAVSDVYSYYGVTANFAIRRVPCLDLLGWLPGRITFGLQMLTYLFALGSMLHFERADLYYSRDMFTLLMLSLFVPRAALCYEVHQLSESRFGKHWQGRCARRVGTVVAITTTLAERMRDLGATHVLTEHDGFRVGRFAESIDQTEARQQIKLPVSAYIIGYVGRLQTMAMSKGVDTVIEAVAQIKDDPITLVLVGGPDDAAARLRDQWLRLGLAADRFIYCGAVAADQVPRYLAALDVGLTPLPWTEHFAYYASSLKLFEYMAAGRAILASDLPSIAEVVRNEHSALLVPPGDVDALAAALHRLYTEPATRQRLGAQAQSDVGRYAWISVLPGFWRPLADRWFLESNRSRFFDCTAELR